jgi:signal peptidase I
MESREQDQSYIDGAETGTRDTPSKTVKNEAWEWIKALAIAGVLVFVIRFFVFAPFIVEGPSMEPNFYTNERLIVNKILYDIRAPKRGEVVVFHAPEGKDYIKRVIALPGELVKVEGDKVYINGQEMEQTFLKEALDKAAKEGRPYNTLANYKETKVPEGSIFAMGDNRSNSKDSRDPTVGFVPYKEIVGRADLIFWPVTKMGLVHFK